MNGTHHPEAVGFESAGGASSPTNRIELLATPTRLGVSCELRLTRKFVGCERFKIGDEELCAQEEILGRERALRSARVARQDQTEAPRAQTRDLSADTFAVAGQLGLVRTL